MALVGVYGLFRLCVGSPDEVVSHKPADPSKMDKRKQEHPCDEYMEGTLTNNLPHSRYIKHHGPASQSGLFDD
jgi:hypothetical protein